MVGTFRVAMNLSLVVMRPLCLPYYKTTSYCIDCPNVSRFPFFSAASGSHQTFPQIEPRLEIKNGFRGKKALIIMKLVIEAKNLLKKIDILTLYSKALGVEQVKHL